MKILILLITALMLLALLSCTDKNEQLTEVNIQELNVPDSFNYETMRTVTFNVEALYFRTVKISTRDGEVLYTGMLNPGTGLQTKLSLPYATKNYTLTYGDISYPITVSGSSFSISLPDTE